MQLLSEGNLKNIQQSRSHVVVLEACLSVYSTHIFFVEYLNSYPDTIIIKLLFCLFVLARM